VEWIQILFEIQMLCFFLFVIVCEELIATRKLVTDAEMRQDRIRDETYNLCGSGRVTPSGWRRKRPELLVNDSGDFFFGFQGPVVFNQSQGQGWGGGGEGVAEQPGMRGEKIEKITSPKITQNVTIDTDTADVESTIGRQTASAPLFAFLIRSSENVVVISARRSLLVVVTSQKSEKSGAVLQGM